MIGHLAQYCDALVITFIRTHSLKGSAPIAPLSKRPLTSACIQQLRSLDEAQVAGPGPQSVGLPEAESGVEMVCLQALLPIDGVVATGIV